MVHSRKGRRYELGDRDTGSLARSIYEDIAKRPRSYRDILLSSFSVPPGEVKAILTVLEESCLIRKHTVALSGGDQFVFSLPLD